MTNQPGAVEPGSGPGDANGPATRRLEWMLRIAIGLIVIAVFGGALKAGFVSWDDPKNIYENPHLGLGMRQLHWMFTDASYVRRYLPLGWLSYSVDRAWFGGAPISYHAGNLLLHVVNALLLFAILRRLLERFARRETGEAKPGLLLGCAALGTLFWAVNPLRVEPVAWASARIYCVSGFFALLSVWAYLRGCASHSTTIPRGALWVSAAAYGLSVFTYPITLMVPAILVVLDVVALGRLPGNPLRWGASACRSVVIEKAMFLVPAVLMLVATLWAKFSNGQVEHIVTLDQFSLAQRFVQGCYVLGYYVWKPWLPDALAPKYPTLLEVHPFAPVFLASVALVAAISILLWRRRGIWPVLAGAWLVHTALLIPVLGLTEHPHHTFDRYSYLQGTVWAVLVAAGLWKLGRSGRWRFVGHAGIGGFVVLFASWSLIQVRVWNNSFDLQTRMVVSLGERPEAALHETVRGVIFMERRDLPAAEAAFRHALELNPGLSEPWRDLGDVLADRGQAGAAVACYRESIERNPTDIGARLNLGIALGGAGRLEEAASELQEALRINPRHAGAHHNLAITLNRLGRADEAREHRAAADRFRNP